MNRHFF